jgi:hypothetical protein
MDAMADDWESISQIEPHVRHFHGAVAQPVIFSLLRHLHEAGHLRIMDENGYQLSDFPESPETAWFSMTESGRLIWDENGSKYRNE